MLKTISICAALVVLCTCAANAQQQEAVLKKLEVPGAGFDIVIAMPKSQTGETIDYSKSPDALVVPLIGGELALAFDDEAAMLKAINTLQLSAGDFDVQSKNRKLPKPIALYVVPNGTMLTSAAK